MAYVIPIPKNLSPKSFEELRPISLLPAFAKLFEKILESRMTNFINKNLVLTPSQYGFRENSSSTELAIIFFYDKLLNNLNENKITCSIFLDLKRPLTLSIIRFY